MSFRNQFISTNTYIRKESDSLQTHSNPKTNHLIMERASSFTSKGSITLEAAFVIPLFFFAILCMMYLFEIMSIQSSLRCGLQSIGKELAEEAYVTPIFLPNRVKRDLVEIIGEDRLNRSLVADGADGLSCSYSKTNLLTGVIELNVRYQLEIPVLMFRLPIRTYEERLRIKGWNGLAEDGGNGVTDELVYVTEHGTVYHKSLSCTYLELSIRAITRMKLYNERNESGEIYYTCEKCGDLSREMVVYITDYGNRYHTSLNCSGLKRSIHVIWLSEVNGLGGCSKCVY